ncbi:MAG: binding-protein-dependent transport system inner rane component [Clostridia bacterium]|jgi:spermidine/putrescine transport system permease protein|nr:binding-protein-dependent transport system inner rane component [Clostridia bacterium]
MMTLNDKKQKMPMLTMLSPITSMLIFLVVIPLIYVLVLSFCKTNEYYQVMFTFSFDNYKNLLSPSYFQVYMNSIVIAAITTVICIVLGYPFAYYIVKQPPKIRTILYMLVIIPFWTNSLIRIYGWKSFLGASGLLNNLFVWLGITHKPLELLFNRGAVVLGMTYTLFPFMVLPLYTAIEKLDLTLIEASYDLGARKVNTFLHVILPLTSSGIFAGAIMVFIPTLGFFFVSDILGGGKSDMIGNLIERQFGSANNWPLGSALSIILILLTLIMVRLYTKAGGKLEDLG